MYFLINYCTSGITIKPNANPNYFQVSQGVQKLAETCGSAGISASEEIANVAQKVELVEQKAFPRRRNGLD